MNPPTVFVVDDDAMVRDSLALLLETAGHAVRCHASAEDFLAALRPDDWGCMLLDLNMPTMKGDELQAELIRRHISLPVIFLTAYGDIPTTVRAMKAGALDFLTKPVDGALLVERVKDAIHHGNQVQNQEETRQAVRERLGSLTEREREILALALAGMSNKAIGEKLGISYRTVELHRSRICHKAGASNLLELARQITECNFPISDEPPAP